MNITDIKMTKVAVPTTELVVMSVDQHFSHCISGIIEVYTDEGIVGLGEVMPRGTPLPRYEFEIGFIKKSLIGEDPFNIERIVGTAYYSSWAGRGVSEGVLYGIEMACWDIIGKKLGVPVYKLMGGKYWDKVPITRFLGMRAPDVAAKDSLEAVKQGVKTIKLKAGRNPEQDIEAVRKIREAVGEEVEIRVDPNQAWSVPKAINILDRMSRYHIQFIEQPIPSWELDGLLRLKQRTNVPICVCEGLSDAGSLPTLMRLIKIEAVDFVSTDPQRTAGLLGFKKLCAICEAEGIPVAMHWSALEISTAAWLHCYIANRATSVAADILCSNLKPGPVKGITTSLFKHERGFIEVPDKPGLGVELDMAKLKRWADYFNELSKAPFDPRIHWGTEGLPTALSVPYYAPPRWS